MTIGGKDTSSEVFTYSQIINSVDYNRIMSEQHLYISAADRFLADFISSETNNDSSAEVVELGCGPARILPIVRKTVPNVRLSAVEADEVFANDASKLVAGLNVNITVADVELYKHHSPVDVFYSQGFHHHVSKGRKTKSYLKNVFNQLRPGGVYVLSDEFLPDYQTEAEREKRAIVWYSHIIARAALHNYGYLAQEEAKTLLDDIYEGRTNSHLKSMDQIKYVLSQAPIVDSLAREGKINELQLAVNKVQDELRDLYNLKSIGDQSIDLSRHDYRICQRVLNNEILEAGFVIEDSKSFGPIKDIGAMTVYILRK